VRLHVLWRLCGYCVSGTGCIHPQWHLSSAGDDVSSLESPLVIVAFCVPCDVRWRVVPRYCVVQTTGGGCNIDVRRHQRSRSFGYPCCTPPAPRVDGCLLGFGFGESRARVDKRGRLVASPRCPYLEGVCMYNDTFLHPTPHPPTVSDACDRQIQCEVVVSVTCGCRAVRKNHCRVAVCVSWRVVDLSISLWHTGGADGSTWSEYGGNLQMLPFTAVLSHPPSRQRLQAGPGKRAQGRPPQLCHGAPPPQRVTHVHDAEPQPFGRWVDHAPALRRWRDPASCIWHRRPGGFGSCCHVRLLGSLRWASHYPRCGSGCPIRYNDVCGCCAGKNVLYWSPTRPQRPDRGTNRR
jgi:hypothetical protein